MIKPKFCWNCGHKLEKRDAEDFNTATGGRNFTMVCTNTPSCYIACGESSEGHDYKFWSRKCKKCGHLSPIQESWL